VAVRTDEGIGTEGRGRQTLVWRATASSGVALVVLITVHMVAHHFVVQGTGGLRSYREVLEYVANPAIFTIELLFLVAVTVHAMLGLRGVLFDLATGVRARAWISRALVVLGVVTVAYGVALIVTLASRA
jgi:succinate dehydrogenase / fumarate reductase, membrane anchor subunit